MIVDCYTHSWDSPELLGISGRQGIRFIHARPGSTPGADPLVNAGVERHQSAAKVVDISVVVGFCSQHFGAEIPNEQVAQFVRKFPQRLIGFAGVDPSNPKKALDDVVGAKEELGLSGIAVAPAAQNFHPSDSRAMRVYSKAVELRMPVLFHPGLWISPETRLDYARPFLLDEVAREFPEMRMLLAHLGLPWMDETVFLLAKHLNVYAEISGLLHHPWQAYQSLMSAHEQGVMDKLLFGSGFPFSTPEESIETLFGVNRFSQGTNLPVIPRDRLRAVLHRDALAALNLERPAGFAPKPSIQTAEAPAAMPV